MLSSVNTARVNSSWPNNRAGRFVQSIRIKRVHPVHLYFYSGTVVQICENPYSNEIPPKSCKAFGLKCVYSGHYRIDSCNQEATHCQVLSCR